MNIMTHILSHCPTHWEVEESQGTQKPDGYSELVQVDKR